VQQKLKDRKTLIKITKAHEYRENDQNCAFKYGILHSREKIALGIQPVVLLPVK